jgi:thermostable 8-oxoguanine DNA glycosylase
MEMTQEYIYLNNNKEVVIQLPSSQTEVMEGVVWGEPCALFTPAYWYTQHFMRSTDQVQPANRHRIGETLAEEIVACILGGYGIPAEVGDLAFRRIKQMGLIETLCADVTALENALHEPLQLGTRSIRYRFWRKKARYLAGIFNYLQSTDIPTTDAIDLRNRLMTLPGIGPKTASWTVRNWTNSNDVAILDVHVVRAGRLMNLYGPEERVEKDYMQMERKFIVLAKKMAVPTADLDSLIWSMMRTTPRLIGHLLGHSTAGPSGPPSRANPDAPALKGKS